MDQLQSNANKMLSFLDNEHVSSALSLFLVLYAGMAAPQLPERVARLFENTLFRILIFFLIAYTARKNASVAAIAAVGLMVSLQTLNRYDINRSLNKVVGEETVVEQPKDVSIDAPAGVPESASSDGEYAQVQQEQPTQVEETVAEVSGISGVEPDQPFAEVVSDNEILSCKGGSCSIQTTKYSNAHKSRDKVGDLDGFDGDNMNYGTL
jgi:hypothetical protein